MLLFKYFEKRDLPDPNGALSAPVPAEDSVGQPTKRYSGAHGISTELAASEGTKCG